MLGNAYIRNPLQKNLMLDRGVIFESLLFFDKLHVFVDLSTLNQIIKAGFFDDFLVLVERGFLSATFAPIFLGVHSQTDHGLRSHMFILGRLVGGNKKNKARDVSLEAMERELGKSAATRAKHKQFCESVVHLEKDDTLGSVELCRDDILDGGFATDLAHLGTVRLTKCRRTSAIWARW